ncbi:carboxyl transferase domain-containing protein [Nocardia altamirensis]|uniref:carboxyl transferase domain-containing protein n=1 Tax=Nocardia altamirensis TaxID=472158 RepID=UPI000A041B27|nr:carboxyl transferase domain-containing protein [Nocardia altamirensis]
MRVVVVNRGEVAVRVVRTARERGWETLAVYTAEERDALHVRLADDAVELRGTGAAAYLEVSEVVAAARKAGTGALVHPGYGFLSESAGLAAACAAAELVFVGPAPEVLHTFGDKVAARAAAQRAGVGVLAATAAGVGVGEIAELLAAHPDGVMVKAAAGGGGRGMRVVREPGAVAAAYERCRAEALAGFGDDAVYAEALVSDARHIEVQVVADGTRAVALGDRDCSVQRRHQKLIEIAPAPNLAAALRERLHRDAVRLAESVGCRGVITVEFLMRGDEAWFLEVNPRLQVEHTVTEEVTGVDLVTIQLDLAQGCSLAELALPVEVERRPDAEVGVAEQVRAVRSAGGARVDADHDHGRGDARADGERDLGAGDARVGPHYDSGAGGARSGTDQDHGAGGAGGARVVTDHGAGGAWVDADHDSGAGRARSDTDRGHGAGGLRGYAVQARVNAEILTAGGDVLPSTGTVVQFGAPTGVGVRVDTAAFAGMRQGAQFDSLLAKVIARGPSYSAALRRCSDALAETVVVGVDTNAALLRAVLDTLSEGSAVSTTWFEQHIDELATRAGEYAPAPHAKTPVAAVATESVVLHDDEQILRSPMGATVVSLVEPGTVVAAGAEVAVLEAMKMQHVLRAEQPLQVRRHVAAAGAIVDPHAPLLVWIAADHDGSVADSAAVDLDAIRPDLAEVHERHRVGLDAARPAAVAKRHRLGRRTARENLADLVDADSFVEYGALAVAAQRLRRSPEDLIANTPADGLIGGVATINADRFGADRARVVVMSYDYTVLAGTQGMRNHAKTDRMLELARAQQLPVVFYTEGGGGRPGDTDYGGISGLDVTTFRAMGALSGRVPLVGIVSGRCFAGNAALLGMCDVVIATPDANIGMGGPAMIEGGGLGVYAPEDIGPIEVQRRNGVVHIVADDEADAVRIAQRYLAYCQGPVDTWIAPDPRLARHVVPENRLHAFDIRDAIDAVADVDSVLELRRDWAVGIVTALIRVEGHPYGLIANNCHHLGGAIDAPAADKLSSFLRLCESYGLPVVSLCDTPGFMVGPDAEKDATVTKFSRLFIDAAALSVPWGTVIVRKGYGLGAQAMAAGSFRAPRFVIAWPTGEIGGMGLEGAVRLGFAKELAALTDPAERQQAFDNLVALAYANGKALTAATVLELDDVIDPAETRRWIRTLR